MKCLEESDAQPTFQDRRQRWAILASADWGGSLLPLVIAGRT